MLHASFLPSFSLHPSLMQMHCQAYRRRPHVAIIIGVAWAMALQHSRTPHATSRNFSTSEPKSTNQYKPSVFSLQNLPGRTCSVVHHNVDMTPQAHLQIHVLALPAKECTSIKNWAGMATPTFMPLRWLPTPTTCQYRSFWRYEYTSVAYVQIPRALTKNKSHPPRKHRPNTQNHSPVLKQKYSTNKHAPPIILVWRPALRGPQTRSKKRPKIMPQNTARTDSTWFCFFDAPFSDRYARTPKPIHKTPPKQAPKHN